MLLLLLSSCDVPTGTAPTTGTAVATPPAVTCSATANLEIVPLTSWGTDLEGVEVGLDRDPPLLDPGPDAAPGTLLIPLEAPVELQVAVQAPDHAPAGVRIAYGGGGGMEAFTVGEPAGAARTAIGTDTRTLDGRTCPVVTVYLAPDHLWFAARGRPPSRNRVELFMDGEEHWERVAEDLRAATRRVTWSTWWWESDFELVRPPDEHVTMSAQEREANTVMAILDALEGVERRVIVNQFYGSGSDWTDILNTDEELVARATATDDDWEVLLQGNPTEVPYSGQYTADDPGWSLAARILAQARYAGREVVDLQPVTGRRFLTAEVASYHQKAWVIDGAVAWISGMNTKAADWDTSDHLVFDPRRMTFESDTYDRQQVEQRYELPDVDPRKDYGIRLEGPAVRDVEEVLEARWDLGLEQGDEYALAATPFELDPAPEEPEDGVPAQVIVTLPEPLVERSLGEGHEKALRQASRYIYIEDQYFRAPMMWDAIIEAMDAHPDMVLTVVTMEVADYDGGAKFTYLSDALLRERYPDRYQLLQLHTFDLVAEDGRPVAFYDLPINLHSKIRLVDDRYLSVGSCNFNNRGYLYEGEMNLAVLDEETAAAARERILANLVGPAWAPLLTGDPRNDFDVLAMAAADNRAQADWWAENAGALTPAEARDAQADGFPSGFVLPLATSPDYWWDVGPDLF